ncbi:MAG: HAMP domain-containing protein [Erysipelotrichia bacterium]|nr:HAMP domain-containing protein [Erysipelotrichia bacterium]
MLSNNRHNSLSRFEAAFLIFSLFIMPLFLLREALAYFEKYHNEILLGSARKEIMQPLHELAKYHDSSAFWCLSLNAAFNNSKKPQELAPRIENLAKKTGETLQYIIWSKKKKIAASNFRSEAISEAWKNLVKDLFAANSFSNKQDQKQAENRVKELLGPHFFGEYLNMSRSSDNPRLSNADAAARFPLFWLNHNDRMTAIVLFRPDVLKSDHRLHLLFDRWQHKNSQLLHFNEKDIESDRVATDLKRAFNEFKKNGKKFFNYGNTLIGIAQLGRSEYVISHRKLSEWHKQGNKSTMLTGMIMALLMLLVLRSAPEITNPANASIKSQLLLLMVICSGIPMLLLALTGIEHLQEKRLHLVKLSYQSCVDFLQEIDKRSQTEISQVLNKSQIAAEKLKVFSKSADDEFAISKKIFAQMHNSRIEFRAIASSANFLISKNGCLKNDMFYKFLPGSSRPQKPSPEMKVVNDIGSFYLAFLNKTPVDPKRSTEIELLTEMFYQKTLTEMLHEFTALDSTVSTMGWGTSAFPVFTSTVSCKDSSTKDFYFMATHNPEHMSLSFILRNIDSLNRNPKGFKIFFSDTITILPTGKPSITIPELDAVFSGIGYHPSTEPQTCIYEGQSYIFAGFQGQFLQYKLLAMVPMASIEISIAREQKFIIWSAIAALIILLSLTLLFSHSFIFPLSCLQAGARAVEKRELGFQLPELTNDEFGEIGRIFNQTIGNLEELSLASIVQTRLMPARTIDSGNFSIFGHSIPMAELGGDYFDYFTTEADHFSVLLGDVAGHGVGASLIMAMAKAGIICSADQQAHPALVLSGLHKMICTTRSKSQRKIMTFQYLHINKNTGTLIYANAGGCSPMLVCPSSGEVKEITLNAPVLGGFKNSKFGEIEINMQAGEALVLYTDGIVEAQNHLGEAFGYERIKSALLKNYDLDAKKYYENLYKEYLNWLDGQPAQDDLTLIVMIYMPCRSTTDDCQTS